MGGKGNIECEFLISKAGVLCLRNRMKGQS